MAIRPRDQDEEEEDMDQKDKEFQLSKGNVKKIGHRVNGRITDAAVLKVVAEEENGIEDVFEAAREFADHAGRETIKEEDVRMAYKYLRE